MLTRRMIIPLLFGLIGAAILISLGAWQLRRLEWKESILSDIDARIHAQSIALPDHPTEFDSQYLPVTVTGELDPKYLRVLVSRKLHGAGYRLIHPMTFRNRRIMVDRGFISVNDPVPDVPTGKVTIVGNLLWPDDTNNSTPEPDKEKNIWFSRDVELMRFDLATDPVLMVAREKSFDDPGVTALPVDTVNIPNDHRNYAITWFSLAVVWLGMTALLLWRIRRRTQ